MQDIVDLEHTEDLKRTCESHPVEKKPPPYVNDFKHPGKADRLKFCSGFEASGVKIEQRQFAQQNSVCSEVKPSKCDLCWEVFSSEELLYDHVTANHETYPFDVLAKHLSLLTENEPASDNHSSVFRPAASLENATSPQPSNLSPAPLKNCDASKLCSDGMLSGSCETSTKNSVVGQRPFHCDECGKAFNEKWNLKQHKLIHTGKKPFQCEICNRAFLEKSKLKRHYAVHTDERPFQCSVCPRKFR